MSWRNFLYRRLARWVTFEVHLWDQTTLSLGSKYDAASFADVFCDPFYWQAYDWITPAPRLVVDCGAHCGHFTILVERCIRARYGKSDTRYLLVEPNPRLIGTLTKNIRDVGLTDRVEIKQNLLGPKTGSAELWLNNHNFLGSGLTKSSGAMPHRVEFIDLSAVIGPRPIDLMKIDIEGGEFEMVRSNPELFARTQTIFMELHDAPEAKHQEMISSLAAAGLTLAVPARHAHGCQLLIFSRNTPELAGAK